MGRDTATKVLYIKEKHSIGGQAGEAIAVSHGDIILIRTLTANCYLVLDDPPFLVDTNAPKYLGVIKKAIADQGVDIKHLGCIILTHFHYDHTGNAAELVRLSGTQVWAPAAEAAIMSGEAGMPLPRGPSATGRLVSRLPRKVLKKYLAFEPVPVARELREGNRLPLRPSAKTRERYSIPCAGWWSWR